MAQNDDIPRLAILGLPRSGTTVVSDLLALYVQRKSGFDGNLGEYFNPWIKSLEFIDTGSRIGVIERSKHFEYQEEEAGEVSRRLWLLRKYQKQPYVFKLLCSHASDQLLSAVRSLGYGYVLLERANVFDQLLSMLLAKKFGVYYYGQLENSRGYHRQVLPIQELNRQFYHLIHTYYSRRGRLAAESSGILYYEDFEKLTNKLEVFSLLGITDWQTYLSPDDPTVMHLLHDVHRKLLTEGEKLALIENREEVLLWMESKMLSGEWPIPYRMAMQPSASNSPYRPAVAEDGSGGLLESYRFFVDRQFLFTFSKLLASNDEELRDRIFEDTYAHCKHSLDKAPHALARREILSKVAVRKFFELRSGTADTPSRPPSLPD